MVSILDGFLCVMDYLYKYYFSKLQMLDPDFILIYFKSIQGRWVP